MVSLFFVKMCFSLLTPTRRCGFNALRIRKSPREHFSVASICCNSTPTTTKDDDENIQEVDGRMVWSVSRWDEGAKICISSGWLNNYKKLRILMKHFRSFSVSQLLAFSPSSLPLNVENFVMRTTLLRTPKISVRLNFILLFTPNERTSRKWSEIAECLHGNQPRNSRRCLNTKRKNEQRKSFSKSFEWMLWSWECIHEGGVN